MLGALSKREEELLKDAEGSKKPKVTHLNILMLVFCVEKSEI
jgi:hypothetical protein